MTSTHQETLNEIVNDLATKVDDSLRARVEDVVDGLLEEVVREAAILLIVNSARNKWRSDNLARERAAQNQQPMQQREAIAEQNAERKSDLYQGKYVHGSVNSRTGAVPAGCECEACEKTRQREFEWEASKWKSLHALLEDFTRSLRMEWTQELLDTGIAMPDGTVTTWGAATIEQHQARVTMLTGNAMANTEAAARHQCAIKAIRSAGVATLSDLASAGKETI